MYLLYICLIKKESMDIDKSFWSLFSLTLALIPPALGLLLFEHKFIKQIDVLRELTVWSYLIICIIYSACFLFLHMTQAALFPKIFNRLTDGFNDADMYRSACFQVLIYSASALALAITYLCNGSFIHFIGNSFIVLLITTIFAIISTSIIRIKEKRSKIVK